VLLVTYNFTSSSDTWQWIPVRLPECLIGFLKASWAEQEQSLRVEMDKLKEKATELQSQNTALHQELERVSEPAGVCIIIFSPWHL